MTRMMIARLVDWWSDLMAEWIIGLLTGGMAEYPGDWPMVRLGCLSLRLSVRLADTLVECWLADWPALDKLYTTYIHSWRISPLMSQILPSCYECQENIIKWRILKPWTRVVAAKGAYDKLCVEMLLMKRELDRKINHVKNVCAVVHSIRGGLQHYLNLPLWQVMSICLCVGMKHGMAHLQIQPKIR